MVIGEEIVFRQIFVRWLSTFAPGITASHTRLSFAVAAGNQRLSWNLVTTTFCQFIRFNLVGFGPACSCMGFPFLGRWTGFADCQRRSSFV